MNNNYNDNNNNYRNNKNGNKKLNSRCQCPIYSANSVATSTAVLGIIALSLDSILQWWLTRRKLFSTRRFKLPTETKFKLIL